jgi:serine/threonine protein phosphatase 1
MVNRGKNSAKVLDTILELTNKGHQIYLLRGNHEQRILNAAHKPEEQLLKMLKNNSSSDLLKAGEKAWQSYLQLMESAYHYFELDNYLLVHAGFDFSLEFPFKGIHAMLYKRNFKIKKSKVGEKQVIHGHTPQSISNIIKRIKSGKRKICIDNGCVNSKTTEQGNLICLNLDTLAVIIQPNAEK